MKYIAVFATANDAKTATQKIDGCESFVSLRRHLVIHAESAESILARLDGIPCQISEDRAIVPCSQSLTINDDLDSCNWGLARTIRRRAPWRTDQIITPISTFYECVRDGSGVDVYVLDTGIRTTHDEFGGRASIIYEYVTAGADGDDNGHGTRMASVAAGSTIGFARGANVFSCKISTSAAGNSSNAALIAGIDAMITHYDGRSNPAVCNVSYAFPDGGVLTAISDAIDAGILMVGAAGNDGLDLGSSNAYPGEATDGICVAALAMNDTPSYFARDAGTISQTSYGASAVDICAPGCFYRAASHTGNSIYERSAGSTSGATAHTTGVIACMLQGHSKLTGRTQVQAVKAALLANATTGRLSIPASSHVPSGGLPDRILYLSPTISAPEDIPGI